MTSDSSAENDNICPEHSSPSSGACTIQGDPSFAGFTQSDSNMSAVDRCLGVACKNLGFQLAEVWSFRGEVQDGKAMEPICLRAYVQPATIELYGKRVLLGHQEHAREKHSLSPTLVINARQNEGPLWFTSSDPDTPMHENLPLNTAVALPLTLETTHKDMVVIFFSMDDVQRQEVALEMLKALSRAACTACMKAFPAFDWETSTSNRNFSRDTSVPNLKKYFCIDHAEIQGCSPHKSSSHSPKVMQTEDEDEHASEYELLEEFENPNLNMSWDSLHDAEFLVNGSRCTIYTAFYKNTPVVVKLVRKDIPEKNIVNSELLMEMEILLRLRHPNIVRLIGGGHEPERFMVIERLDGGTLAQRCGSALNIRDRRRRFRTKTPFNYLQLVMCAKQLAEALKYMHEEAIPGCMVIHRDLKPDNIAFDQLGNLKILDLGLSKVVPLVCGEGSTDAVYELTGETGSLRYMAPEVAMKKPYNAKADVYGFGMILWEMASMRKPFETLGRDSFFEMVVYGNSKPAVDRNWPPEFIALLDKCWAKNPVERPTFDTIIKELQIMINDAKELRQSSSSVFGKNRNQNPILGWLRRRQPSGLPNVFE